jgi:myosin-5
MAQKKTVSSIFRVGLEQLVDELQKTNPHYIKCIKPNAVKLPGGFSNSMVCEQVRSYLSPPFPFPLP